MKCDECGGVATDTLVDEWTDCDGDTSLQSRWGHYCSSCAPKVLVKMELDPQVSAYVEQSLEMVQGYMDRYGMKKKRPVSLRVVLVKGRIL